MNNPDECVFPENWVVAGVRYPPGHRPAVCAGVIVVDGIEYTVKWTGFLHGLNLTRKEAIISNGAGEDYPN